MSDWSRLFSGAALAVAIGVAAAPGLVAAFDDAPPPRRTAALTVVVDERPACTLAAGEMRCARSVKGG